MTLAYYEEPIGDANSEADFLLRRRQGIGGSDVAAIFGLSKWKSPLAVYHSKIGEELDPVDPNNNFIKWGNILEEPIAREFTNVTGKRVHRCNRMLVSKDHKFIIANIDRNVIGESAGLEVKTAIEYKRQEWDGSAPLEYVLQCMHYMYVTGYDRWYLAVLIGGNTFEWFQIDRDEKMIEQIVDREVSFWKEHVEKRVPPSATSIDSDLLFNKWRAKNDQRIDLSAYVNAMIKELIDVKGSIKKLESTAKDLENKIKAEMGECGIGETEDYVASWKEYSRRSIDSKRLKAERPEIYSDYEKESLYRRFSVKEIK